MIRLEPDFEALLAPEECSFDGLMAIEGEVFRALEGRRTVRFERGGRGYFIKQHFGVGWREIAKNLAGLRLPVLGARSEWEAIDHLARAGLLAARVVGRGERGRDPARRQSFVVLEELTGVVSLEDLAEDWRARPPGCAEKRALIAAVGALTKRMHESGLNHRDFYLCHILKETAGGRLFLLDLHRAQIRNAVPRRWAIKDLGGLYFSAMDAGLTRRDRLRFVAAYAGRPWRQALADDPGLWRAVEDRAGRLWRKHRA